MRHKRECVDCSGRQAERVFSLALRDPQIRANLDGDLDRLREEVGQRARKIVECSPPEASPAEVSFWAILEAHKATGCHDPFLIEKRETNVLALRLYSSMKRVVEAAADPIFAGCLLAASGNIIDLGIQEGFDIQKAIDRVMAEGFAVNHYDSFRSELEQADRTHATLLYILDNAGEIVFDRILMEEIMRLYPSVQMMASVNSGPILNDATMEDAGETGLCDLVPVIENGHQDLGTILDRCSAQFKETYFRARLIIAKGQANYETLDDRPENIFFILKAKCEVIAQSLGVGMYDAVLVRRSR